MSVKAFKIKYSDKFKSNPGQYTIEKENGRFLWIHIDSTDETKKDPEVAALLKRIRVGKWTNSDFELLNTRLIPTNVKGNEWSEVPIFVSRNIFKMEINKKI
jgi:hypothetical protein